jgi:hypothetical protein
MVVVLRFITLSTPDPEYFERPMNSCYWIPGFLPLIAIPSRDELPPAIPTDWRRLATLGSGLGTEQTIDKATDRLPTPMSRQTFSPR